ncbi:MAG: hypothetical protein GY757_43770 [bacterium]|nr:hypothetical protein [bacterium]
MGRRKKKKTHLVHVFAGAFLSRDEADSWSQASYMQGPDNPTCPFWDDIGYSDIDHDFQVLTQGPNRYEYLQSMLVEPDDMKSIEAKALDTDNTLLLIFQYNDIHENFVVTGPLKTVRYNGSFPFDFAKMNAYFQQD